MQQPLALVTRLFRQWAVWAVRARHERDEVRVCACMPAEESRIVIVIVSVVCHGGNATFRINQNSRLLPVNKRIRILEC